MEKILKIEECLGFDGVEDAWCEQDGFKITTTEQEIYLVIDNMQCCCENFGYFMSEDNIDNFIGADLLDIKITDTISKSVTMNTLNDRCLELDDNGDIDIYEGGVMFVDIITSNGVLQFVAYNEHNGYYGHDAWVISKQLKHNQCL